MKYIALVACLVFASHMARCQQGAPATAETSAAQNPGLTSRISGKVIETMNASEYTYIQVNSGTNKVWIAAPRFAVKVGDTAAITSGMPMPKYHSKALNRDFDVVYFASGVIVNGAQPGGGESASELPKDHPPINAGSAKPKLDLAGIKKVDGGRTVQEICTDRTKLAGQQVKVRGRVVKYNPGIMGKNWLHIRDGSGTDGSNDMLVTTSTDVKLGDLVLVTGAVAIDKDFGANYKYAVMIEDAKVAVEP
jgi:hypothetical protein